MSGKTNTAAILMNLGTPREPSAKSVAAFLGEFLSDPRVVEAPRLPWAIILKLIVIPRRRKKVAAAYRSIWTEQGSPLRVITEKQVTALREYLDRELNGQAPEVTFAMSYGGPSLADRVDELEKMGVERFVVLPLYPQYSASTTGAVYDQVAEIFKARRNIPDITICKQYYNHELYIEALARSVTQYWRENSRGDFLLMSFHGIPKQYMEKGDPYYEQCSTTARMLAEALHLQEGKWSFSFQSRFGPKEWLKPYTDTKLECLAREGVESVDIISPAFAADCLETLEELAKENRDIFINSGGKNYQYIPCLNGAPEHIAMMAEIVKSRLTGA